MDRKTYFGVVSLVFVVIAVVHGLRVLNGWDANIGDWEIPLWVSYLSVVLGAYLAWTGYQFRK